MVLTVSFALSSVTGLFCHRRLQVTTCKLDTSVGASGPHDFAVRLKHRSSSEAKASTASRPTFVTMANVPLSGETGEVLGVICPTRLGKNVPSTDKRELSSANEKRSRDMPPESAQKGLNAA